MRGTSATAKYSASVADRGFDEVNQLAAEYIRASWRSGD
jgi:hypothetical protein